MCSLTGDIIILFTHPFNNYPSQPKSMRPFCGFLARHFRDPQNLDLACLLVEDR